MQKTVVVLNEEDQLITAGEMREMSCAKISAKYALKKIHNLKGRVA